MTAHGSKLRLSVALALLAMGGSAVGETGTSLYDSSVSGAIAAPPPQDAADRGHLVFDKWCSGCHAPDYVSPSGNAAASPLNSTLGTYTLRQKYGNSMPAAIEQRTDLSGDVITVFVRNGINLMPPFRKTEIDDAELSDLIAYLSRNSAKP
jgi:mono/diheme cytochrome c family protein